ncbi:MAG: hypothetical protein ACI8P9_004038, partial [Parasphingorhabdus sp.]
EVGYFEVYRASSNVQKCDSSERGGTEFCRVGCE